MNQLLSRIGLLHDRIAYFGDTDPQFLVSMHDNTLVRLIEHISDTRANVCEQTNLLNVQRVY